MAVRSPHRTDRLAGACTVLCFCVTVIAVSPLAAQAGPRIVDDAPAPTAPAPGPGASDVEVAPQPEPVATHEPAVVAYEPVWDPRGFEFGMLGGVRFGGEDYIANEALYGMAVLLFRWRVDEAWALVTSFDVHGRDSEDLRLSDVGGGLDFGANWYLLDGRVLELFMSFGATLGSATVSQQLPDGVTDVSHYGELGLYVGMGTDVRLGDWVITTEMRTPMLFRVDSDEPMPTGRGYVRRADEFRSMLQWTLGAGYRF